MTSELICLSNFRESSNYTKILYNWFTEGGQIAQIREILWVRSPKPDYFSVSIILSYLNKTKIAVIVSFSFLGFTLCDNMTHVCLLQEFQNSVLDDGRRLRHHSLGQISSFCISVFSVKYICRLSMILWGPLSMRFSFELCCWRCTKGVTWSLWSKTTTQPLILLLPPISQQLSVGLYLLEYLEYLCKDYKYLVTLY